MRGLVAAVILAALTAGCTSQDPRVPAAASDSPAPSPSVDPLTALLPPGDTAIIPVQAHTTDFRVPSFKATEYRILGMCTGPGPLRVLENDKPVAEISCDGIPSATVVYAEAAEHTLLVTAPGPFRFGIAAKA